MARIGRVERAQSSATAALLNKLCAALDVTLSDVVALAEKPPERLVRLSDQPLWRDPDSGYLRRNLSAPGFPSPIELVEVIAVCPAANSTVPAGTRGRTCSRRGTTMSS